MRLSPSQDEQRWSVHNCTIAVLLALKTIPDKMMLDQ
jgi:hypothetical protein